MDRPDDAPRASHDLRDLQIITPRARSAHTRERRATIIGGRVTFADKRAAWTSVALHVVAAILVAAILSRSSSDVIVIPADFHITLEGRIASPSPPAVTQAPPAPAPPPREEVKSTPAPPVVEKPQTKGAIVPKPDRPAAAKPEPVRPPSPGHAAISAPTSGAHSAVLAPNEIRVGAGGGVTGTFPFAYYLNGVRAAIQRSWAPPRGAASGGALDAVVRFTISRDGSVRDVIVEERSGVTSFDQAAATAVRRAAPFAPLPHAYAHDDLVVHLGFHYAE